MKCLKIKDLRETAGLFCFLADSKHTSGFIDGHGSHF